MKESPEKSVQPKPQVEQTPKPKYEPPQVIPLNDIVSGQGQTVACQAGSGFIQL
jgi:hypothetical protein